ncbi:YeaH/YhbH family protein [Escherichia coli]|nr:YeaH/YhbH family protein [Escherichia coli]
MAKRFYIPGCICSSSRTYKNVEVVYIRHHTQAKEVDEHEVFLFCRKQAAPLFPAP